MSGAKQVWRERSVCSTGDGNKEEGGAIAGDMLQNWALH